MIPIILITFYNIKCILSMDPVTKDLLTPLKEYGEYCGYESCLYGREGHLNVHIVPHTHGELGVAGTFYQQYTGNGVLGKTDYNMKRILDFVITQLWENTNRRFALGDMPYFFHWWSQRDGTVRRMVYELIRQGRLQLIGGGWGMSDEATTSYHAIIDMHTYSLRKLNSTFLECGRPLVAFQSDVFGHSREFASLAAQMGFDALFISPISFEDELSRMERKSLEFLWRGSDDLGIETDIFSHKLFDGYWSPPGFCFSTTCSDPLLVTSDSLLRNVDERVDLFIESMLFRQSPGYNTSHIMVIMGQRMAYFDANIWFANIEKLIASVNEKSYKMKKRLHLMYSTPACYMHAVHRDSPVLETKQDDFFPVSHDKFTYLSGIYTSRPSIKLLAREGHLYLTMAKQLQVTQRLLKDDKNFEEFKWIVGVFQDHNIITGGMRRHVKDNYAMRMDAAIQKSTLILKRAFNKMRNSTAGTVYYRCQFNISSCNNSYYSYEYFIVIYNPLGWPVTLPVRLPAQNDRYNVYDPSGDIVQASLMKIPYPVLQIPYRNHPAEHELVFMAVDVPPLGYRSYYIERVPTETPVTTKRAKRAIIKKLKRKQNKKYLIRQNPTEDKVEQSGAFDDLDESEDEFFGETTSDDPLATSGGKSDVENILRKDLDKNITEVLDKDLKETKTTEITTTLTDDVKNDNSTELVEENDSVNYPKETLIKKQFRPTVNPDDVKVKINEANATKYEKIPRIQTNFTKDTNNNSDSNEEFDTETDANTTANPEVRFFSSIDNENESNIKEELRKTTTTTYKPLEQREENDTLIKTTTTYKPLVDPERETNDTLKSDVSRRKYEYFKSDDLHIKNKYITISLDPQTKKITGVELINGVKIFLDIQFYYYVSDDANVPRMREPDRYPGVYVMRTMDNQPVAILDYLDAQVYKNFHVEELHCIYGDWASLVLRLYTDRPVIEVDWLVGPVPIKDGLGKEVFIRYMTDIANHGVFYTDSNGRQTIKRIRNSRPLFEHVNRDAVAGNYYPVTTKIYIEDVEKNIRFSIFNDRAQGGTSLYDGEVDLMLHRRILTDDTGAILLLNDTIDDEGVRIRGKHYLYLSKADYKPNKIFEKKFAKEIELMPQIFVSRAWPYGPDSMGIWSDQINERSGLKKKLPVGIHLLTLEEWNDDTILLRLENYLEKSDTVKSGIKKVFLNDAFENIRFLRLQETTLAANMWLKDFTPIQWKKRSQFLRNFNQYYGNYTLADEDVGYAEEQNLRPIEEINLDEGITLSPQQIRTFVCWVEYINVPRGFTAA